MNHIYNPFSNLNNIMKENLLRLFIGMIPSDLPKDLFFPHLEEFINSNNDISIDHFKEKLCKSYSCFIQEFEKLSMGNKRRYSYKNGLIHINNNNKNNNAYTPSYIYGGGAEPIKYDGFKYSGQLRLMGLENPILYSVFIYNTFIVFHELLVTLYSCKNRDLRYPKYPIIKTSDSPILVNGDLVDVNEYHGESYFDGIERYKNSFSKGNENFHKSLIHKSFIESEYPYYMTLDIQSFFPNIYTHNLERIGNHHLYKSIIDNNIIFGSTIKSYFKFLDTFNMKNDENKTKGVIVGPISSKISSELLSLDIYNQAERDLKSLFSKVKYARYMDDVIVFANDRNTLEKLHFKLGRFLQKYELEFQDEKYKIAKGIFIPKSAHLSSISSNISFVLEEKGVIRLDNIGKFLSLKCCVKDLIDNKDYATIKALLTKMEYKHFIFYKDNDNLTKSENILLAVKLMKILIRFMLKIAITYPVLAPNIYRFLENQIRQNNPRSQRDVNRDKRFFNEIKNTLNIINDYYDYTTLQIWTYYLLNVILNKYNFGNQSFENINIFAIKHNLLKSLSNQTKSYPLIIMSFISSKNKNFNNKIASLIIHNYESSLKKVNNSNTSNKDNTIIFSKWSFPIYKLYSIYGNKYLKQIFKSSPPKNKDKIACLFDVVLSNLNLKSLKDDL